MFGIFQQPAMTISVVIPTFNSAAFIGEALDSVMSQTLPVAEIIVVDDGSTDATEAIVAGYPQVKWTRQSHQGPSAARNCGIRQAQSAWIAFLDSDDLWHPEKLGKQLAALRSFPSAGFSFSTLVSFFDRDNVTVENEPYLPSELQRWLNGKTDREGRAFGNVYPLLLKTNCVLTSSLVARRQALLEAGLFDETMRHGEDHDLWLRLARRWPAVFIIDRIATYRIHSSAISGQWEKRQELFYRSTVETLAKHRCMFPSYQASKALAHMYNHFAMYQLKERAFGEAKSLAGLGLHAVPTLTGIRLWLEAAFPRAYSHAVGLLRGSRPS